MFLTFLTEADVADWQYLQYSADTLKRPLTKLAYTCVSVHVVSEHSAGGYFHFYSDAWCCCAAHAESFAVRAGELLFTKSNCSDMYSPFTDRRTPGNVSIKEAAMLEAFTFFLFFLFLFYYIHFIQFNCFLYVFCSEYKFRF